MDRSRFAGVILAGGESRRFGRDKALALFEGEPLVSHVARSLVGAGAVELVVASRDFERAARHLGALRAAGLGVPLRAARGEPPSARGPLAGMLAGAGSSDAEWVAFAACDAPLVPSGVWRALVGLAREHGVAAAFADPLPHPLLAVARRVPWAVSARGAWARGERSARRVLEGLGFAALDGAALAAVDAGALALAVVHEGGDLSGLAKVLRGAPQGNPHAPASSHADTPRR